MPNNFKKELRTIQTILKGSPWAAHPDMTQVLGEYGRIVQSENEKSLEKRSALQILFSSRAIDSLLVIIVKDDCNKRKIASPNPLTIGSSLHHLRNLGMLGKRRLDMRTYDDLGRNVLQKRNKYLHKAGQFPSINELHQFVSSTLNGIRVISRL